MAGRDRSSSVLNLQIDQTTFLPAKIPTNIHKMVAVSGKLTRDLFRKVLQVVIKDIEGSRISEDHFAAFRSMFSNVPDDKFCWLYSGLLSLMKYALRHPQGSLKKESFVAELVEIRLNKEFIEDICLIVFTENNMVPCILAFYPDEIHVHTLAPFCIFLNRQEIIKKKQLSNPLRLPSLASLRWRVDVTISTSVLNRVLEPTILMEIKDSDGKVSTFEVTQAKFHELRYNIAHLLKEMEDLETRSILKVES